VNIASGYSPSDYTFQWTSSCGGSFTNGGLGSSVTFTPPSVGVSSNCTITVTLVDACGRQFYEFIDIVVNPAYPNALDVTSSTLINNPGSGLLPFASIKPLVGTDSDGTIISYTITSVPANGVLYYDNDGNAATPDVAISSGPLVLTQAQMLTLKFDAIDGFGGNTTFNYTVTDNSGLIDLTAATYTLHVNPPPVSQDIISPFINSTAGATSVSSLVATDNTGVVSYTITSLPPASQGILYLNGVAVTVNQVLTPLQATQLSFDPSGSYTGYVQFSYTATDTEGALDATPATFTFQLVNQAPIAQDITTSSIANPNGTAQTSIAALAAIDLDGTIASFTISSVPNAGTQGILYYDNAGIYTILSAGIVLTPAQASSLKFDPVDGFVGNATFSYTATDNNGLSDPSPATYTIPVGVVPPIANNITNPSIYAGAAATAINPFSGSDPDATNVIVSYTVSTIPPASQGILYYNNGTGVVALLAGTVLTPAQITTLQFDPSGTYVGNVTFTYTLTDNEGLIDPSPATYTIPVVNQDPVANNVTSASIPNNAAQTAIAALTATDADGTVASFTITSLPLAAQGVLYVDLDGPGGAAPVVATQGMVLTLAQAANLFFDPTAGFAGNSTFTYTATDNLGATDKTPATYTIPVAAFPIPPVASNVTSASINASASATSISPLAGTDADGTVKTFTISTLPAAAQGILYLNGVPVTAGLVIFAYQANQFTFDPTGTFVGNATFTFTCTDNEGLIDATPATFTIPVVNNAPVANNVTINDVKTGNTIIISPLSATDTDGSIASFTVSTLPTLGTLQVDLLGGGVYSNVTLGQVLTPAQAGRLQFVPGGTQGTSTFTFTATDNLGLVDATPATYTIPISGANVNQPPFVNDIVNASIAANAASTAISPLSATDVDGTIVKYTIISIPPSGYGTLYYNNGTSLVPITEGNTDLTVAQVATLQFDPTGSFVGNVVFTYTATDNSNNVDVTPGTYTIPLTNAAPTTSNVFNASIPSSAGPTLLSSLVGADADGTILSYTIVTLPAVSSGVLLLNGVAVVAGQSLTPAQISLLQFDPDPLFTGTAQFTFTAVDNLNAVDQTPATFSIPVTNTAPNTDDKTASVITNTNGTGAQSLSALTGSDPDGSVVSFVINTIPTAASGVLYLSGVAVTVGQVIPAAQAGLLSFDPTDGFSTNAVFTYSARDNSANTDATPATYTIPVNTPPTTADITAPGFSNLDARLAIPALSGADNGTVVSYTILSIPVASQGLLYVDLDGAGPGTPVLVTASQVITPAQISFLSFDPALTFTGTSFTYTATDNYGVSDVTPAIYNLPVISNAGPDQVGLCGVTSTTLAANSPSLGTASWSIISGTGGSFSLNTSPTATFTGTAGTTYTLRWTVTYPSSATSTDDVFIKFGINPTTANAGPDQIALCSVASATLAATPVTIGTGTWTIVDGTGGSFSLNTNPAATFSGTTGSYKLRWTAVNVSCSSTDDVIITFNLNPDVSNAGPDQSICSAVASSVFMAANNPLVGSGSWSQSPLDPLTGTIATASSFNTQITGLTAAGTYEFKWTISNDPCTATSDLVKIVVVASPSVPVASVTQPTCLVPTATIVFTAQSGVEYGVNGAYATSPTFSGLAPSTAYTLSVRSLSNTACITSAAATVAVNAVPNCPPVAVNDSRTINEDTPVTFIVTSNDTDSDGTINVATVDLDPATAGIQTTFTNAQGTFTVTTLGAVTFTPVLNFNGIASITYTVNDNIGATSNPATIAVTVTPVNDAPVLTNLTPTTAEDVPFNGSVFIAADKDPDGTALTVNTTPVSGPTNGTIVINADGTYTYTPNLNFNGTDVVTVQICDNGLPLPAACSTKTLTFTITPVNDAPVAVSNSTTTNEDTPVAINVTANDTDVDGTINVATVDLDPATAGIQTTFTNAQGTFTVNTSGVVTFTPVLNFNGTASTPYTVNDNLGLTSNQATISITVTPVNDAPVLTNLTATTAEDVPFNGSVFIAADKDPDGTALTVNTTPVSGPSNGTIMINADGTYTYTPNLNFNGTDVVTVQICDNGLPLPAACSTKTLTFTITPVNDAPVAVSNSTTTNEDTPVAINVTANDTDMDGTINVATVDLDPATAGIQTTFTNAQGTFTVNTSGVVTFTPVLNFNGTASTPYTVNDNLGLTSNQATISITVTPVNDAPVLANLTATTAEDVPFIGSVFIAADKDPDGTVLTVNTTPVSGPTNGTIVINADGTYTYTPNLNFNGTDVVTVQVCDNGLPLPAACSTKTLTFTIIPVNDAPVAVSNATTTSEDTPVAINVTTNDTDVDGTINVATVDLDPATAGIQTTFTNAQGTWAVDALGNVTFTPVLNFNGTASTPYTVNDNLGLTSNQSTISITVTPVNDAPVAVSNSTTTNEDTPVAINVTTNDTDVDGTINVATVDLDPATAGMQNSFTNAQGTWAVDALGNVTFTPALNFNGIASITYTVNDNTGATSNPATIAVTITPVNDAPVLTNLTPTTAEDVPFNGSVFVAADKDPDGTALTVNTTPVSGPSNGTIVINADGTYTYTPNLNFNGTDVVTVQVCDNGLPLPAACSAKTLTFTITPVNDAPVAVSNATTTSEDTPVTFSVTANDTDVDGTINVASVDLDPATAGIQNTFTNAQGTWAVDALGNVTFTPVLNFNGIASIPYTVNDNTGATSNPATIAVTVNPVNDAPVAVSNSTTTNEDTPVAINVTANDTDVDGTINVATVDLDPATAGIQTTFTNAQGTWAVDALGNVTFTPVLNFNGTASTPYTVNDNLGLTSNQATISITVTPVNDAPVLTNLTPITTEDAPFNGSVLTAADKDPDGTALTVSTTPVSGPSNGTIVINADGTYTYTPNLNFNGTDVVTVQICDNGLPLPAACSTKTLTFTITPVNDAPVAVSNATTTNEDTPVAINVTANDTDVDGTINVATVDLDPATAGVQTTFTNAQGTFTVDPSGVVTFTPVLNFNGTASTPYTVNDNLGLTSNQATISITVTPVNDAPVAVGNSTTTSEDTPVTINITTNDTDVDGTINVATVDLDPATAGVQTTFTSAQGTWGVDALGNVTFTPLLNFNGIASITYTVNDNTGATSNPATIAVTVTPVNDAPVLTNLTPATAEDVPFNGSVLVASDKDPDGTALTVNTTPVSGPSNGTILINADGTYTYTPNLNFSGTDVVTVQVCDNGLPLPGACSTKTLTFTITPVNDAPVAVNNSTTTNEDTPVTFSVTANDTDVDGTINVATVDLDPSTAGIQTTLTNTSGVWSVNTAGDVTFTPALNFNGTASISYTVNDNSGAASNPATIAVTVTPVNDAPILSNDAIATTTNTPVNGDLINTSDIDPDGTALVATTTPVSGPFHGTIIIRSDGTYTYTPNTGFNGTDVITVQVCDSGMPLPAQCANQTLTISISAAGNIAPVAVNDSRTTNEDTPITFSATANDTDVDGTVDVSTVDLDPSTTGIQTTFTNAQGTFAVNTTGDVTFTPTLNFNGSTVINYTVNDSNGATSNVATLSVTINAVNDAPVAVNNASSTNEDTPVTLTNIAANDTDVDGTVDPTTIDLDPATAGIQTTFTNASGAWSVNPAGDVTFTPALNFNGTATLSYTVKDNSGAVSNSAILSINVAPINDAPVAINNAESTNEDTPVTITNIAANDTDVDGTVDPTTIDLDPATAGIQTTFTNASGAWSVNATGDVTFTPALNFNGTASIPYTVNDNNGKVSNVGTISVNVNPVNDAPVAVNDSGNTTINTATTVVVTSNDTDADGTVGVASVDLDPATAGIQATFTNTSGTWRVDNAGVVTFTPALNFTGAATTTYTVNDNNGATSNIATITINVGGNIAPVAVNDTSTTNEDTPVTFSITSNDTDVDGTINVATVDLDPATAGIQTTLTNAQGTWKVDALGSVTFTPALNFNGTASIPYTVSDNSGTVSNVGTITVNVNPVNDPPVLTDIALTMEENGTTSGSVLVSTDTDPDGTALTVNPTPVSGPSNGVIVINSDGTYTYTPNRDFSGTDVITVQVCDSGSPLPSRCTTKTITILINSTSVKATLGFSPNGDTENEAWIIRDIERYPNNVVKVFNRWGNLVYETNGYNNKDNVWIGQSNGRLTMGGLNVPDGTYFYVIDLGIGSKAIGGYVIVKR
jgi:large repetitive protein